jgi:hypothetical protein
VIFNAPILSARQTDAIVEYLTEPLSKVDMMLDE